VRVDDPELALVASVVLDALSEASS